MIKENLVHYEKIVTVNDESFLVVNKVIDVLLNFIKNKCEKDAETMQYFQINFTDSEKCMNAKDMKIKWCVSKNN